MTNLDKTIEKLNQLKLNAIALHLNEAIKTEKNNNHGFLWLIDHLIDLETEQRWKRAIDNR